MLADLRFMLGAVLAVTVLAVAGLGMATSVELMRAANMGPLADSRSLAYAGPAARNAFYDPATARHSAGEKIAAPQPAPPTPVAPLPAPEQTASLPADPPAAVPVVGEGKEIPPAPTTEARAPATPAPVEAAAPAEPPPAQEPAPEKPVAAERVASASAPAAPPPTTEPPAAAPASIATPPAPQVAPSAESKPPPHPKPAFKKRIARRHLHRALATTTQQPPANSFFGYQRFPNSSFRNSQFPTASASWPIYNNNFWGATAKRTR